MVNNKRIGCYLVVEKDDGVMLDEIFLEEENRNKGVGSSIIKEILESNNIVYLCVYKENTNKTANTLVPLISKVTANKVTPIIASETDKKAAATTSVSVAENYLQ